MKIIGIIPARYQSSRFPGKALADIEGKPMIQRVYEQTSKASGLDQVWVATDHDQIFNAVRSFSGKVVMTGTHHRNGTERCGEALSKVEDDFDYVINIQGDEPFINPVQIDELIGLLNPDVQIATLAKKIETSDELFSKHVNKVILDQHNNAIYFSRSPLPFLRDIPEERWLAHYSFLKHVGLYAYRADILKQLIKLEPSSLELAEGLEQLRWLENGYRIKTGITSFDSIGIDTPEDLKKALLTFSTKSDS